MKIRNGFVSNSSSSSFVIVGKKLTNQEKELLLSMASEEEKEDYFFEDHEFDIVNDSEGDNIYIGKCIAEIYDEDYIEENIQSFDHIESSPQIQSLRKLLGYSGPLYLMCGTRAC